MNEAFPNPDCVLVISAHPDDPEFGAAGTVARWTRAGTKVVFVLVTDGSKGTEHPELTGQELIEMRHEEASQAARILGVAEVVFLDYEDGRIENNVELRRDITRQIRLHRPEIVITHDPTVRIYDNAGFNHPDHRAVGDTVLDCIYPLARDRLNFPEHEAEGLDPHKVLDIFLTSTTEHNYLVDITDTIDLKLQALLAHESQMPPAEELEEFLRERHHQYAQGTSFEYGERFRRVQLRR